MATEHKTTHSRHDSSSDDDAGLTICNTDSDSDSDNESKSSRNNEKRYLKGLKENAKELGFTEEQMQDKNFGGHTVRAVWLEQYELLKTFPAMEDAVKEKETKKLIEKYTGLNDTQIEGIRANGLSREDVESKNFGDHTLQAMHELILETSELQIPINKTRAFLLARDHAPETIEIDLMESFRENPSAFTDYPPLAEGLSPQELEGFAKRIAPLPKFVPIPNYDWNAWQKKYAPWQKREGCWQDRVAPHIDPKVPYKPILSSIIESDIIEEEEKELKAVESKDETMKFVPQDAQEPNKTTISKIKARGDQKRDKEGEPRKGTILRSRL